jgi:L-threonylcarbamoyladenylate synthase
MAWMERLSTEVVKVLVACEAAIRSAAAILHRGGLVAFPTETVYGLGAHAENESAVRAMFAAKGRPADHPVIVHLADAAQMEAFAANVPDKAQKLAAAFWPGPMTLVLKRSERVNNLVTGGLDTVGLRVPSHPVAQALLREFGGPIAAPSANRFGRVSCTRAEHVEAELGGRVDLILDGGECTVGLESTIIDVSSGEPAILRPGAVTAEDVARILGTYPKGYSPSAPRVSGSLPSHYAPQARVEIVTIDQLSHRATELLAEGRKLAVLTQQPTRLDPRVQVLSFPQSPADLAHALYDLLRQVDALGCDVALATLPSNKGLGAAIVDRLRRAAGPRNDELP